MKQYKSKKIFSNPSYVYKIKTKSKPNLLKILGNIKEAKQKVHEHP